MIRQGSGRRTARVLLLTALLLTVALAGCRKEIPEEKARAIFTEIASELKKRPDAGDAAKSAMVDAVCEKNGFQRRDLEYLLKTRPEAETWLEAALKAEIGRDLDGQRDQWERRLTKARDNNRKNAANLEKDQRSKFEKIKQETARKKARTDQEFKGREKNLKAKVEALKKDLRK